MKVQVNLFFIFLFLLCSLQGREVKVTLGCERLFDHPYASMISGKRIGLITNQTGVNHSLISTLDVLKAKGKLTALFAPEHGIRGEYTAEELVPDMLDEEGIPIYSLHGKTFRPTPEMFKNVDVLIYDIQDIGSRSYTYATTLYYVLEEAAKLHIPVIVLDRPNPINGITIDGPVLLNEWRSVVGYINVPYCHGMTIGELAQYFNNEYQVNAPLYIVPMKGWRRSMSFEDTGLPWIPTSPNIPDASTPLYYPITGILGELSIVSIGIGYTLPFELIGAPWIDANKLASALNSQQFPGVYFVPWHFKPYFGKYAKEVCHGVLIKVTNSNKYLPVSTQFLILGVLKNLFGEEFNKLLADAKNRYPMFNKVNGTDEVLNILLQKKHIVWPLRELHSQEREEFKNRRSKYLIYPD